MPYDMDTLVPMPVFSPVPISARGENFFKRWYIYWTTKQMYILREDWYAEFPWCDLKIMVPKGTVIDFASIPRSFRWAMSPTGPLIKGAVPHDIGYQHNCLWDWDGNKICINAGKEFFDDLFKEVTIQTSGFIELAEISYYAVDKFGGSTWDDYRQKELLA